MNDEVNIIHYALPQLPDESVVCRKSLRLMIPSATEGLILKILHQINFQCFTNFWVNVLFVFNQLGWANP